MKYVSTRGGAEGRNAPSSFTSILLEGLAQDGGLFLPERYPTILLPELKAMREMLKQGRREGQGDIEGIAGGRGE